MHPFLLIITTNTSHIMKNLLLLCFLFIGFNTAKAQKQVVGGTLRNETEMPIENAYMMLFMGDDTSVVAESYTDAEGGFILKTYQGHYMLKTTAKGYKTEFTHVVLNLPQDINLGVIQLSAVEDQTKNRGCIFSRKKKAATKK